MSSSGLAPDSAPAAAPVLPAAVLWDMDGTIVDTEPFWMAAEGDLVTSFGGTWTHEQALTLVGQGLETSAAILQEAGVRMSVPEIIDTLTARVQEILDEKGPPLRPGAVELLTALSEAGVRCALVTMSLRRMAEQVVSALPSGQSRSRMPTCRPARAWTSTPPPPSRSRIRPRGCAPPLPPASRRSACPCWSRSSAPVRTRSGRRSRAALLMTSPPSTRRTARKAANDH